MKNILVIEGPGFAEQIDICDLLQARGDNVVRASIYRDDLATEFETADAVLLRAPWTLCSEEKLLARSLAQKLEPGLTIFQKRQSEANAPMIFGIGRGALVLLASNALKLADFDRIEWVPMLSDLGPWVEVQAGDKQGFPGLLTGRACPSEKIGNLQPSLASWLWSPESLKNETLGFCVSRRIFISFVDLFAFGSRTQIPDYGYRELANLPTQAQILYTVMDGEL